MAIVPTPAKEEVVDADRTKANAMLREQFLRFVANICQKSVSLAHLHQFRYLGTITNLQKISRI